MKTRITYKFVLKPEPNKKSLYPIYLRAFLHGKKTEIATGITIPANDWAESKQRVKKRNKKYDEYNSILEAFDKKALKGILTNFIHDETPLTLSQFKDYMLSVGQGQDSFTDYILNYLEENKTRLRPESWWSYKSQVTKMLKFKKQICFADVNEKFISEYQHYMSHELHNNENTISKSLRSLRTFVNVAMRYGYIKTNPFRYITIKKVDGKRDFLSLEELNILSNAYFTDSKIDPKEKEILCYFLFSCYTGLRYSDLKSLQSSAIKDDMLHIKMHKTSHLVSIPLSQKAFQLLPQETTGNIFRVYCNKVTNKLLKKIATRYKIDKELTFHVARHTFATVSISLGIPIEVISKLLGHTNLKTTQVYAKIVDSVKTREMEKWNHL